MKHFKRFLAIAALASAATLCFAVACTGGNAGGNADEDEPHQHEYAATWEYDEQYHWHPATCEHDYLQGDRAAHSFTEVTDEELPTCTEDGYRVYTCVCGAENRIVLNKLGHDLQKQTDVPPTCQHEGKTDYYKCTREDCGYETYKVSSKTDHVYHIEIVEGEEDSHHEVCGFCGEEKAGSKQKHIFDYRTPYKFDENTHWQECTAGCGATDKAEGERDAHTYNDNHYEHDDTHHWLVCDVCGETEHDKELHDIDPLTGLCSKCDYSEDVVEHFTYAADGDNFVVSGWADVEDGGKTVFAIPAKHEGKDVVGIAEGALAGNTTVTRIVLPDTIVKIGDYAFEGCTALEEINLEHVTQLGTRDGQIFNGCEALEEVSLNAAVTTIYANMFKGCKALSSVTLGGTVTKIDTQAFSGCEALTEITGTLSGVTFVGQRAFANSGLTELTITLTDSGRIAQGAFLNCKDLATLTINGGTQGYLSSPILEGCTGLVTLTLPFVGQHSDASKSTDIHFGYIFGETEEGYAIPENLTTLNIKGGSVELKAFENCGNLTVNADTVVTVKTKTFSGYTGTFTWNGTLPGPSLSDVQVDKPSVLVGVEVTLSYTVTPNNEAPNTTTVTVTVKKDGSEATLDSDYTVEGTKYTFKTKGEFTLEVVASYNDITDTKTVTVTVELPGPNLGNVTASGNSYENGRIKKGETLTLTFTYDEGTSGADKTAISYEIKKGGEAATPDTDYTVGEDNKSITFNTFGAYEITVKATRNEHVETKTLSVLVYDEGATPPTITSFTADTPTLTEGGEGSHLTLNATYSDGDALYSVTYKVTVENGGNYEDADSSWYEITDDVFKAKIAGNYKVKAEVVGKLGGTATSEDALITVNAVELHLELEAEQLTNGWVRRTPSNNEAITYTVGADYADGYNVTYEGGTIEAASGDKLGVIATNADENTVTFKVIYTHKNKNIAEKKKYELSIRVSFVSDVATAPVLGEDPFDKTGGSGYELLNSTGLQLYWDITDIATDGNQLGISDVSFSVVKNETGKELKFYHVAGEETRAWYMVYEDFQDGTTTGEVTVKITATKNGETAAATQVFTVRALSNPAEPAGMNDYLDKVMTGGRGAWDAENWRNKMARTLRENSMITKNGIVFMDSANQGWQPEWDGALTITVGGDKDNFQVDFDLDYIKKAGADALFKLTFLGPNNSWNEGDLEFYINPNDGSWPNKLQIGGDLPNRLKDEDAWETNGKPEAGLIHLRLTHTLADGKATFVWAWSTEEEPTNYNQLYKFCFTESSAESNSGSRINGLVFRYMHNCYSITNVKVTTL